MTTNNTATEMIAMRTAIESLNRSSEKSDLDDLIRGARRSLLLVDCSGSMGGVIRSGDRKIDALRKVVTTLRETHPVPVAAFGVGGYGVEVVDVIPEPCGSTPLGAAIEFGTAQGATHLVVVTDGEPNSEEDAFTAARAFGGVIDTFYIGDGSDRGSKFCSELAKMTGGTANLTDLGKPKELAGKIVLMLGDGTDGPKKLAAGGAIQL